jgi:putative glutamine amidotransferase
MKRVITYVSGNHRAFCPIFALLGIDLIPIRTTSQLNRIAYDGILLQGGQDISPHFYGQNSTHAHTPDEHRDRVEWFMVRQAMTENVPILGICRGMQLLTVAHGGSLYQDVKMDRISGLDHRSNHWLTAVKWPIRQWLPDMMVNSRHHQAVRTVPAGMKVVAKSPDGLPEAVWRPGVLGVQWHPEDLFRQDHAWAGLFRWFRDGLQ